MIVAGSNHINEVKTRRINDQFRHAGMGLFGASVLMRERIRQVGVKQQILPVPLDQVAALPQPPEVEGLAV